MKEGSELKIKAILNSTPLKTPILTPCLAFYTSFNLLDFLFFEVISLVGGQLIMSCGG